MNSWTYTNNSCDALSFKSLKKNKIEFAGVKFCKISDWKSNTEIEFPIRIVEGDDLNKNIKHEEILIIKKD